LESVDPAITPVERASPVIYVLKSGGRTRNSRRASSKLRHVGLHIQSTKQKLFGPEAKYTGHVIKNNHGIYPTAASGSLNKTETQYRLIDMINTYSKNSMHKSQMQKLDHDRYARAQKIFLGKSLWVYYDKCQSDLKRKVITRKTDPLLNTVEAGGADLSKHTGHLIAKQGKGLSSCESDYSIPECLRCDAKNQHAIQIPTCNKKPTDDVTSGGNDEAADDVNGRQGEDWAQDDWAPSDSAGEAIEDSERKRQPNPEGRPEFDDIQKD